MNIEKNIVIFVKKCGIVITTQLVMPGTVKENIEKNRNGNVATVIDQEERCKCDI